MKLINPSVENVVQMPGMIGMYKHIEKAMRCCYKSEDKINDTSYERMLNISKDRKHYSPLEHGSIYLTIPESDDNLEIIGFYQNNPYSRVVMDIRTPDVYVYYITTNFRVVVENDRYDDLNFITEPSEFHIKRYTFNIIGSRIILDEAMRHRAMSISTESTRYCNYSKDKFGDEITFVIPQWIYKMQDKYSNTIGDLSGEPLTYLKNLSGEKLIDSICELDNSTAWYAESLYQAEKTYMYLLNNGFKPEEARGVLPLDIKSETYMTGYLDDWKHFIELRTSSAAHPDIRIIANLIKSFFEDNGLI